MNDSSQESETTLPVVNISSPEDGRCNTRLSSSPSPTRSSGSPDSGYSTIELEPGSRALSLARLAVRVREGRVAAVRVGEGEGEEVVAALHLLARLLDGTWGEEEAKVCLTKPCHHNLHNVNPQVGFQIAPILVECYNGAEETQVRKAALTCLVSLCLQVSLITCSNTAWQRTPGGRRSPGRPPCRASWGKKKIALSPPSQVSLFPSATIIRHQHRIA